jgi:hypothetical protein
MPLAEHLLSPGCTLPACRCGKQMYVASTGTLAKSDQTHIRIYKCHACEHEMRLTVWGADALIEASCLPQK